MPATASRRIRFVHRIGQPGWFVATGVLLGLSFPPFPLSWLALVALVPMLARWSQHPKPVVLFREAYSAFLIFAAISGYWVLFHADTLKALMLGFGVLLLPLLMALPVVGSSLVARRLGLPAGFAALTSGWLAFELILTAGPIPLPWLLLGHSQADALVVNQFADVLGVGGLTLWVLLVNFLVYGILHTRTLTARFSLALATCGLMVLPIGYGAWRMTTLPPASEHMRVAIVQPVLPNAEWGAIASADRVQLLADLADEQLDLLGNPARRGGDRTELVIWPEGALPIFPEARLQQTLYDRVLQWSSRRQVALLAGAVTRYDTAPALTVEAHLAQRTSVTRPYYNSALLFDRHHATQQYDKIQMLPVADQVPMFGWEPGQRLGLGHGFGTGGQRTLFRSGGARFASAISYEIVFSNHIRDAVLDGAEFITVLANPGVWTFSPAHRQLESLSRLRAIETRRAMVTASVSGGSGVILPDGRTAARAAWGERTVLVTDVPRQTPVTAYVLYGDVLYHAAGLLAIVIAFAYGMAAVFHRKRRRRRRALA